MSLLHCTDVRVARGNSTIVEGVSFSLEAGEILAILGPNGAGKSTLLRALAGLLPAEGEILLGGAHLNELVPAERAKRIAYVPQRTQLQALLRVEEVVAQGRYAHRSSRDSILAEAMKQSGADAFAGRLFPELSIGEQQRVLIARALATEAPLLVLDEPTAALDARQGLRTHGLFRRLAEQGRGLVVVLHHLDDALRFADRCLLLGPGRPSKVVASGAPEEVIAPEPLRDVYGVRFERSGLRFFEVER